MKPSRLEQYGQGNFVFIFSQLTRITIAFPNLCRFIWKRGLIHYIYETTNTQNVIWVWYFSKLRWREPMSVLGGGIRSICRQSIQVMFPWLSRPMDCLGYSYVFGELHLKYSYSLLCSDFQHFPYKGYDKRYSVIKSCIHKCVSNIHNVLPTNSSFTINS